MDDVKELAVALQFRQLAELNFQNQNLSDSCFFYINCLKVLPAWKNDLKERFLIVLSCLGQLLEKNKKFSEIFTIYEEALLLYNDCEEIYHNLGAHLLRLGYPDKAAFYFKEALKYNGNYFPAQRNLHSAYCAMVERWHYRMLNDSCRNEAYREAIYKKVKQGFSTVLDIGTGTGLFCLYAAEVGAQKIYACECNPVMLSIAVQVLSENSLSNAVSLIRKHSNEIEVQNDLAERVSLVVTETMDSCMLGEHLLQTLSYAWKYLLHPPYKFDRNKCISNINSNGVVIPYSGSLWFTAVQSKLLAKNYIFPLIDANADDCAKAFANISLKDTASLENFKNLNLNNLELCAFLNEPYDTERLQLLPDCVFLAEPRELFHINFNNPHEIDLCLSSKKRVVFDVTCTEEGYTHAIAAWFKIHLDENIALCSAPDDPNSRNCCWDQAVFPSVKPFRVMPGSKITILSDWSAGKVTFDIKKVTHPCGPTVCNAPLPNFVPFTLISLLNDNHLLMHLKSTAMKFFEKCSVLKDLRILDLYPVPVFGLTVLCNTHLMNGPLASVELVCVVHSEEQAVVIKKIADCNGVSSSWLSFIMVDDFDERITAATPQYFDVILMNLIDSQGDLNEDMICHINILKSLLKTEGFFLPETLEICGQLIHSDYIEENMRVVNNDIHQYRIGNSINEYQVLQMLEINIAKLRYEKHSNTFTCHEFSIQDLDFELVKQFCINIVQKGTINSILYWYNIRFFDDLQSYSTLQEFSYVHQAAYLTKSPTVLERYDNAVIEFVYHHGAFIISLKNCNTNV